MVPPGRGDLLYTLIGRTGKNFIVKAGGAMSTGVRGLTTRGGIGENAFLRAGGGVAQLGEHHVRNVGVEGSIPFSSTILRSSELRMVPAVARSAKSGTTFQPFVLTRVLMSNAAAVNR